MITFRSLLVFLVLSVPGWAALPLIAIREYQKNSPEYVHLEILKVDEKKTKKGGVHYFSLTVEAKVTKVVRSASGLKPGSVIALHYDVPNLNKTRMAGDWAGQVQKGPYEAYLKVEDSKKNLYKPAAHSGSFDKIEVKKEK